MTKPHLYINVSQTLGIIVIGVWGVHYLNIQRDAVGIQKMEFKDRIAQDAKKLVDLFTSPFKCGF